MAIVSDKKIIYEKQLQALQKQIENSGMETDAQHIEIDKLKGIIEEEESKIRRYQIENVRRKHNYIPLIMELLKLLAKEGKLMSLYERAKERSIKKQKQKIAKMS